MAVDKLVDSAKLNADLTSVANAIRTKGGTSAPLAFPSEFVSAVNAIPTGSGKILLADYTASEDVSEIVLSGDFSGYLFYFLTINGNCSQNEWIYPSFNDLANTTYYWGGQGGATLYNIQIPLCTTVAGTPPIPTAIYRLYMSISTGSTAYSPDIGGPFSKLSLRLYNASSLFILGFNVKLWGLTV